MQSDEKQPWWEIEDEVRTTTIPGSLKPTPALSYIIALSTWRKLAWPDRPHP
jgi:hypothetical protein